MRNDKRSKLLEHLVREIDSVMQDARPLQRALVAARAADDSPPWTSRFCNIPTINAVRRYLIDEVRNGATAQEIYSALVAGGAAYNQPHFERDLKNSLGRASKSGRSLIKKGDKYFAGPEEPANKVNRHGRKPLN
jgi:hypothetical protein